MAQTIKNRKYISDMVIRARLWVKASEKALIDSEKVHKKRWEKNYDPNAKGIHKIEYSEEYSRFGDASALHSIDGGLNLAVSYIDALKSLQKLGFSYLV